VLAMFAGALAGAQLLKTNLFISLVLAAGLAMLTGRVFVPAAVRVGNSSREMLAASIRGSRLTRHARRWSDRAVRYMSRQVQRDTVRGSRPPTSHMSARTPIGVVSRASTLMSPSCCSSKMLSLSMTALASELRRRL
jgi:hypothetical protein